MVDDLIIFAHRGACEYAPENTFAAFYIGLYMGCNGIETDIRITKDGKLVLFHDSIIDQLTDGKGFLKDFTYKELLGFNLVGRKNSSPEKIVLFEESLKFFSHKDINFDIEIKVEGIEERCIKLINKNNISKKAVITSFYYDTLINIYRLDQNIKVGLLTREVNQEIIKKH